MRFKDLLTKHRELAFNERDKGDRFERLMADYLRTDPTYAAKFKEVWLWNDFPGRKDLGGTDTGIDLVALTNDGDYWAIQCKCYQQGARIDKKAVDSFLSTSSRTFKGVDLRTHGFRHRLWIDTTGTHWGNNAEEAIRNQKPPVSRIGLYALEEAQVDWAKLDDGISGRGALAEKYTPKKHQEKAINDTHEHFQYQDRGKLIMACGTGKTFTALRIAENETDGKGVILFLVPSIALLGQTLREWTAQAIDPINAICICSDPEISKKKKKGEDADFFSTIDLALPASTDIENIVQQFQHIQEYGSDGMTVVFSTYQSIDVIANAQKALKKEKGIKSTFDLIICDEAHRTTGVTLAGDEDSAFVKVHDDDFIQSAKRLYMTATPRLYDEKAQSKAKEVDALLCSMDDEAMYGQEIYRIGFGEAVEKDLLADYKVLVLTLSEADVPLAVQKMISDENYEINSDDASKLIGCINALSKQIIGDQDHIKTSDPDPMKRAVAFCARIADSKKITNTFNETTDVYLETLSPEKQEKMISVSSKHIDGTMSAPERDELLGWLKEDDDECRILTNVRCLSEGVDVPSLDAVMFLSARNSQVDVVQSVGRVMRTSPGKKYGYIIIPVVIPADVKASEALDDNERYKVVWSVLNALRAHDDRFNATVNKINLNKKKPDNILVGRPDHYYDEDGTPIAAEGSPEYEKGNNLANQLAMQFEELQGVVFARMVDKVGERVYWEKWAKSVAEIASRQIDRIKVLVEQDKKHARAFESFLKGLQKNINPSITEAQAIEMLSQHIITKPVFEALFEGYSFEKNNAISVSMQKMLSLLEQGAIEKDMEELDRFYRSVRVRAEGIDNAEGKQRIIIELYDKFFKTAFPKMVEQLGIVYTPVEVVDFIIHSVEDVLQKEFGRSISDENVHVLDPFTGTGTFITRLIQSGLIKSDDLPRKYAQELHANEIVLLAYYIAAVNIENAYHDAITYAERSRSACDTETEAAYTPFEGICLTDTFQLLENKDGEKLFSEMFPQNSKRVQEQMKSPIRVIMGNPPYSVGQKSANDNAQNQAYPLLDERIASTYGAASSATSVKALYDAYIKAFRWSSDRLDPKEGGVIAFVSNGAWLDANGMDGFRKHLEQEFSSIHVFNLRGNQRTSGELSRKEGGKIFGSGSRTPISITLLVKKAETNDEKAVIYYHDIGDYLSQKEKLKIIADFKSISSERMAWKTLSPDEHGDWLNQRDDRFEQLIPLGPAKKYDSGTSSFFVTYSLGVATGRDPWVYQFQLDKLWQNVSSMIRNYNNEVKRLAHLQLTEDQVDSHINDDPKYISWNRNLKKSLTKGQLIKPSKSSLYKSKYRPFVEEHLYFNKDLNAMLYQNSKFYPTTSHPSLSICVSGIGSTKGFSALITDKIPSLDFVDKSQCFPLHYYEETKTENPSLFDGQSEEKYVRRDGISDFILERAQKAYGKKVTKEDIFYYVYGILHSPEYRNTFANDLKKMLPRIPLVDASKDFWEFSKAGRALAELHINYEDVKPHTAVEVEGADAELYRVEKMRFGKKREEVDGKVKNVADKSTIIYNSRITLRNIPDRAYEYVVNGKSAIEWIMDRYQVKTDKKSGITNDPNDWADEVGNPRYILDLLLSIINVSTQTVEIVEGLPKLNFD